MRQAPNYRASGPNSMKLPEARRSRRRSRPARPPWFRPGRPPAHPAALLPTRPPLRLPASVLKSCCSPRTATHQPQHHPNPPSHPHCPPNRPTSHRPTSHRPAHQWRSCRNAARREQQPTNPSATPTPPGETQRKYPDNNHGRRPHNGHHAQKPGTPPTIRKPTHQPGNTATMRDTRPGEPPADTNHTTGHTTTAPAPPRPAVTLTTPKAEQVKISNPTFSGDIPLSGDFPRSATAQSARRPGPGRDAGGTATLSGPAGWTEPAVPADGERVRGTRPSSAPRTCIRPPAAANVQDARRRG